MDTKKLRQKILDLAIRGKLVPQDPNDEPASVLLERIRAEKERLISEGKIKRPKKSKTTSSESHYQNLPNGWIEIKVGELAKIITDFVASGSFSSLRENVKYYDTPNYAILVRTKDFQNSFTDGLVYTDKHGYEFLSNSNLYGGELILPNIGASIGKVFIVPVLKQPMTLAPNTIMVKCWDEITIKWLYFFFMSSYGQEALKEISSSTAQGKFNKTDFRNIVVPLPPLSEQERIISQIQSFDSIITPVEINRRILSEFIITTKSKILELAMQGKLVPQDPTDEPAAEMLKRINPKAKIITDNSHSRNIPQGWVIANLKGLIHSPSSKQFQILQSEIKQDGLIPVISQSSNFIEGYSGNKDKVFYPNKGIVIFGDHTKNVKFFSDNFIIGADGVKLIDWDFDKRFLFYLITYVSEKIPNKGYCRHFQYLLAYVIGLPPLEEQKRIVAKIEELYSVLDKIEASLQS